MLWSKRTSTRLLKSSSFAPGTDDSFGHRLSICSRMNAAWLIAFSTAATFAGLGLSESNSISVLAHNSVAAIRGRLSSEVDCSGVISEMPLGNDILLSTRIAGYFVYPTTDSVLGLDSFGGVVGEYFVSSAVDTTKSKD